MTRAFYSDLEYRFKPYFRFGPTKPLVASSCGSPHFYTIAQAATSWSYKLCLCYWIYSFRWDDLSPLKHLNRASTGLALRPGKRWSMAFTKTTSTPETSRKLGILQLSSTGSRHLASTQSACLSGKALSCQNQKVGLLLPKLPGKMAFSCFGMHLEQSAGLCLQVCRSEHCASKDLHTGVLS